MLKNRNLLIIGLIAVVNALGYGIIIPVLYSYSHRFGLSDWQNGLLFAAFSLAQFISTPIIGHLSDKYGRRPLLIISLIGTAISFMTMAMAKSVVWLFAARILDGITAGNIPVATAVISDTMKPEERARGFGMIGASFGFGFVFGPAISALTVGIFPALPFWIAACVTTIAVVLTALFLPETNKHTNQVHDKKLFDLGRLFRALRDPMVGKTLLISSVYALAFGLFIFAYQPMSVEVLHLSAAMISLNFTIFGVTGLVGQGVVVPRIVKWLGEKKALTMSLFVVAMSFVGAAFSPNIYWFTGVAIVNSLFGAIVGPVINVLLSEGVDSKSQGEIMGVNTSYVSIGNIIGPIIGGVLASFWIPLPFIGGAICVVIAAILSAGLNRKFHKLGLTE